MVKKVKAQQKQAPPPPPKTNGFLDNYKLYLDIGNGVVGAALTLFSVFRISRKYYQIWRDNKEDEDKQDQAGSEKDSQHKQEPEKDLSK